MRLSLPSLQNQFGRKMDTSHSAGHQVLPVGLPAPSLGVSPGFQSIVFQHG